MKETEGYIQQAQYQETEERKAPEFNIVINGAYAKIEKITSDREVIPRLAFLGPKGTNTDQAAAELFGRDYEEDAGAMNVSEESTNGDLVRSVKEKRSDMAVVPTESSSGGNVEEPLNLIAKSNLNIVGEKVIRIEHDLVSYGSLEEIEEIYTHDQAFKQCSEYINNYLPDARQVRAGSTAGAVKGVSLDPNPKAAAIGPPRAAEIYNVPKVDVRSEDYPYDSIGNDKDSATRFWVIGEGETEPTGNDKTTLTFKIPDRPASLVRSLKSLDENNINLKKLISMEESEDGVLFLATIDGHIKDFNIESAINNLNGNISEINVLGSYAADSYPTPDRNSEPEISDEMLEKARNDKTARESDASLKLLFTTIDEKGSLLRAIKAISDAGVNITHINSIETGKGLDQYGFRMDLDTASLNTGEKQKILDSLEKNCTEYRIL